MPCNCDYMEPNEAEKNSKECAKHIMHIAEQIGDAKTFDKYLDKFNVTGDDVINGIEELYGCPEKLNCFVKVLCDLCSNMTTEQQDHVIYNGRDPNARKLAEWWEQHKKADDERKAQEHREMVESKEYQINSAINVARGRLENDADPDKVIDWLEEEIGQIFKGEILFED